MTYAQREDEEHYVVDRTATTESFEIINDGTSTLFELWEAIQVGTATPRSHRPEPQLLRWRCIRGSAAERIG